MKPCVIIPIYNHGETLPATLQGLETYGLHVYVVDDGSDEPTKRRLDEVDRTLDITRITLPHNQGKGAAVMAAFRRAFDDGYTHAVQVDADGQHDLGDIAVLLEKSRSNPDALVSGNPTFDASVPPSRLYGRKVTRFWVWIETLSFDIPDAMCGLRVYPLESCLRLIERKRIGPRMEFDVEIAVRLFWRGVPFIAVPTLVVYPEGGTSHFRLWEDNLRISWMHTKLFFGMLLRAPVLLLRKFGVRRGHWSRLEERGAVLGMKILFAGYRIFGRAGFRIMLFPVITYYYLTSSSSRRASRRYLDRVEAMREKADGVPCRRLSGFRHFLQFGESILDKAAIWAGVRSRDGIRYATPDAYEQVTAHETGGVFIGSHLGNLEALRAFGGREQGLVVNALMFTRHSPKFVQFLQEASPDAVSNVMQVDSLGPDSVISMQSSIARREWIAMVADRTSISNTGRTIRCDFLGQPAHFPEGPFIVASLLECPVYFLFCLKHNRKHYVYLEKLSDRLELPRSSRQQKLHEIVEQYVAMLERLCLEYPYQWYNFFDFWQEPHEEQQ